MDKKNYINREISWISFNGRVLQEALNPRNLALEKTNFLSISASNLDEFFMVRVGKLESKVDAGRVKLDPAGLTPQKQLRLVWKGVRQLVSKQYEVYNKALLPSLKQHGIHLMNTEDLSTDQFTWLGNYFDAQIMPVLTPRVLNPLYPFPLLTARRLYVAVLLQSTKGSSGQMCLVPVPSGIRRVVMLPTGQGKVRGLMLEDVITLFLDRLFPGAMPLASLPFRITRNTDFMLDIRSADSIIDDMTRIIKRRSYGKLVRLEVPQKSNQVLLRRLMKALQVEDNVLLEVDGPLDLTFLSKYIRSLPGFDHLRYPRFHPRTLKRMEVKESVFRTIRGGDLLFHHPYDSYSPIVRFISEAADDERVLAIKQTLYRVSSSSPFIAALARAAQKGKQVTVLVEVRARFDEENNIAWCRALEKAGCHVIYGIPRWKTHSKIALVVRREENGLNQYLHLGTGNYNDATAKGYTDISILTCDQQLAADAGAFFNIVTGYADTFPLKELIESPFSMRKAFVARILREKALAEQGKRGLIIAKMNSLSDPQFIGLLYEAAAAGVKVFLMVRGVCCLNVPKHGNIVVRSIVGRYLEHARIYIFGNDGQNETFISSADWMPRNLDKRVELTVPVKDEGIAKKLQDILALEFLDDTQCWQMQPGGEYIRLQSGLHPINSQQEFMEPSPMPVDFNQVFHVSYSHAVNEENVPFEARREGQPPAESGLRQGDSAPWEL